MSAEQYEERADLILLAEMFSAGVMVIGGCPQGIVRIAAKAVNPAAGTTFPVTVDLLVGGGQAITAATAAATALCETHEAIERAFDGLDFDLLEGGPL